MTRQRLTLLALMALLLAPLGVLAAMKVRDNVNWLNPGTSTADVSSCPSSCSVTTTGTITSCKNGYGSCKVGEQTTNTRNGTCEFWAPNWVCRTTPASP
jgi:hypothetical protein